MESEVLRRICQERGIPCATVRAISDAASEDLPLDFNQLMKETDQLDFVKLLGSLAIAALENSRLARIAKENPARSGQSEPLPGVATDLVRSKSPAQRPSRPFAFHCR